MLETNETIYITLLQWRKKPLQAYLVDLQRFGEITNRSKLHILGTIRTSENLYELYFELELKEKIRQLCLETFPNKYQFSSLIQVWISNGVFLEINPHKSFNPDTNKWEKFPYKGK